MVNLSSSYAQKNLFNKNVDIKSSAHGDLTLALLWEKIIAMSPEHTLFQLKMLLQC